LKPIFENIFLVLEVNLKRVIGVCLEVVFELQM